MNLTDEADALYQAAWEHAKQSINAKVPLVQTDILQRIQALGLMPNAYSGKKILDLGAGNADAIVDGAEKIFEPWFCRIMHALGALPTALDKGRNDHEEFPCIRIDLLLIRRVKILRRILKNSEFDIIHSHRFLAPDIASDDPWTPSYRNQSPQILGAERLYPSRVHRARRHIEWMAHTMLAKHGLLFWENEVWQRNDDDALTRIRQNCTVL